MSSRGIALLAVLFSLMFVLYLQQGRTLYKKHFDPSVEIDASETGKPIEKYLYGQFIEHVGRTIYGGVWAEMLEDRKFFFEVTGGGTGWTRFVRGRNPFWGEGKPYPILTASPWGVIGGKGTVVMAREGAYVGAHSPRVHLVGDGTGGGIYQERLALTAGEVYTGRIVIAGDAGSAPVEVSLVWGREASARETVRIERIGEAYARVALRYRAGGTTDNGRLEIVGRGSGSFRVGAVSLMPADNVHGMRADTVKLLRELNSPIYRWPGGDFVSGYDWRDGTGDRDRRPPRKNPAWSGVESNDFGLDEFMTFCREVKTEPYVVVNSGRGDARLAAEEVEYANGSPETPMGKLRAANGHARPYGVKLWGIGNEMWAAWQIGRMPLSEYTRKHNRIVDAMRRVDRSIRVVAIGDLGEWSEGMLADCTDHSDFISEHVYAHDKPDVAEHVAQLRERIRTVVDRFRGYREEIDSLAGKDIRLVFDEWNYWYGEYVYGELGVRLHLKDALGIAAGLHEFFRNSDQVFMANYTQTVNAIGAIKTSARDAAFAAPGLTLQLYRNHFGVIPVEVGFVPEPFDVTAAWTDDRKALTVAVVNPSASKAKLEIDLEGARLTGEGRVWTITGAAPMLYNEPGEEPRVRIAERAVERISHHLEVPRFSVSLFSLAVR